MDRVHRLLLGHDDGDLGAVVRAARVFDAGTATTPATTTLWPPPTPSSSRPAGDAAAFQILDTSIPLPSAACGSSPRFQCRSASLPLSNLVATSPPLSAAFRHQDIISRLLQNTEQSRFPPAASFSPIFDGRNTGMAGSSHFTGVQDSTSSFSSSSRATWVPGNKDASNVRLAASPRIDLPEFRSSLLSDFLRGTLTVAKGNDALASADAPESFSSSATVLSRASPVHANSTAEFSVISDLQRSLASPISAASSKTVDSSPLMQQGCLTTQNSSSSTKGRGAKRRKAQQKRVVCIPASGGARRPTGECLPSDLWAWRKYGQKPIKGSPHPRGYYRCSSSKGCPARKQVERSRTDPSMLIVTYTSDHNHPWPTYRNALAGSTRPSSLERSGAQSPGGATFAPTAAPSGASSCEPSPDNPPGTSFIDSPDRAAAEPEECHMDSPEPATAELDADQAVEGGSTLVVDVDEAFSPDHDHGLHVVSSNIPDSLFCEPDDHLGEGFTSFGRQVLDDRSLMDEGESATVDPYNLFNWSSTTFTGMDGAVR